MTKITSNGLERNQVGTQWQKSGQMVFKGVNWVSQCAKIRSYGPESSHLGTKWLKSGQMVLKGVNWVHNDKN